MRRHNLTRDQPKDKDKQKDCVGRLEDRRGRGVLFSMHVTTCTPNFGKDKDKDKGKDKDKKHRQLGQPGGSLLNAC